MPQAPLRDQRCPPRLPNIGGLDISDSIPNGMLLCTTETNTRDQIDRLVDALKDLA